MLTKREIEFVQAGVDTHHAMIRMGHASKAFGRCREEARDEFRATIRDYLQAIHDDPTYFGEFHENSFLNPTVGHLFEVAAPILQFEKAEAVCRQLEIDSLPEIAKLLTEGRASLEVIFGKKEAAMS